MTDMQLIDKVAFLHLVDGKILSTRSKGKDKYYIPGGKREAGETDVQTLTREVKEELSVDIVESSAQLYGIFESQAHGKAAGVVVRMTCYTADFTGDLKADSEIAEVVWLTMADIENVSPVDKLIFADLHDKGLLA
jgi:ADP-ribose pyrophosphatase YjhB (NUDIX family)